MQVHFRNKHDKDAMLQSWLTSSTKTKVMCLRNSNRMFSNHCTNCDLWLFQVMFCQYYLACSSPLPQTDVEGVLEKSFIIGTHVDGNR